MKDLKRLVKVNLKSFFQNKNSKKASSGLLILFAYGIIFFYVFMFSKELIKGFISLNCPEVLLVMFFSATSLMILFTNIFKIDGTIFRYKDYDLLLSLPIDKKVIMLSKIITLYLSNLILVLAFMIPCYITYIINIDVNILFHLFYFITLLIIPLVPIIIATIIGSLMTIITSRMKKRNFMKIIVSIAFFVGIMYLSMSSENANAVDMANIGKSLVNNFNNFYPLVNVYNNIIMNNSLFSLFIFILIPAVLFYLYLIIMSKFYNRINSNLLSVSVKKEKVVMKNVSSTPLIAIYKKELKRLFSSANYFMNTALGSVLQILFTGYIIIFGADKISVLFTVENIDEFLKLCPLILCIFCSLNCTTHSSISLEGNNLWIIKSLPVNPMTIYFAKILVNLTIIIPPALITGIALGIFLKVSMATLILMVILPILYGSLVSFIGLFLNILYPDFTWNNEIKPIKQSLPSFLSIMIGMIIAVVPLAIPVTIDATIYMVIIGFIVLILNIIMYNIIRTVGVKKFKKL